MTQQSTTELEREAEQRRADMAETAERLRAKLTPGQLLDEVANTFRGGDWSTAATNLKTQVRDNPLGLALIGAGIACMAAGVPGTGSGSGISHRRGEDAYDGTGSSTFGDMEDALGGMRDRASSAGSSMGSRISSGASTLSGFARDTGGRTRDAYHSLEDQMSGMLHREPLVVGAIGLAIGAALGALLPETRFEEEHLGPYEERMRKAGAEAARGVVKKAGDVAAAAGNAAMDEADRQGLASKEDTAPLAESVGKVADNALGKADDALAGSGSAGGRASTSRS